MAVVVPDAVKLKTLAEGMGKKDQDHKSLCKDPAVVKEVQKRLASHAEVR